MAAEWVGKERIQFPGFGRSVSASKHSARQPHKAGTMDHGKCHARAGGENGP